MPARILKTPDYLAAAAPLLGNITLGDINHLAGIFGALLGAAYLLWKWRREARRQTTPPFPRTRDEQ